ncbi:GNAT family N-acetyltransferase [Methanosarcina sp. UBA5]|uniref:GNAT family N-acetyltransferase n=1 Tax=Methanosarcina sp. UBA5 TaxID=1915593 RepID=UPI0025F80CFA|nr:N-acetyltransferase [Methanosarcina sp. UBA5]
MSLEKLIRDTAGSQLVKKWRSIKKEEIGSIEDSMLPEILTIQAEAFKDGKPEILVKYVKRFRNIFYVIKSKDKIVGYCIYYLKPVISLKGFEKKSVICSVAIDKNFRGRGFAERLLRSSIEEMKVNGISSILLYVNINNLPAIQLYEKMGFQETRSIKNICGRKETCYEMELKLV